MKFGGETVLEALFDTILLNRLLITVQEPLFEALSTNYFQKLSKSEGGCGVGERRVGVWVMGKLGSEWESGGVRDWRWNVETCTTNWKS